MVSKLDIHDLLTNARKITAEEFEHQYKKVKTPPDLKNKKFFTKILGQPQQQQQQFLGSVAVRSRRSRDINLSH